MDNSNTGNISVSEQTILPLKKCWPVGRHTVVILDDSIVILPFNDDIVSTIWEESICEKCGKNHGYQPTFEGVKTSMDIIPELIEFIKSTETPIPMTP